MDDGSTDDSGAQCDAYAERDGRVKVCHQKNRGLSGARNTGTNHARGNWLVYVDGDDLVSPGFVSGLLGAALACGTEVSCCLSVITGESSVLSCASVFETPSTVSAERLDAQSATAELLAEGRASTAAWAKLARTELWRAFPFPEGRKYEDMPVTWKLFSASGGVAILDDRRYGYVMRSSSITHVPSITSMRDYATSIEQMYEETGSDPMVSRLVNERAFRACLEYSRALELLGQVMAADLPECEEARKLYRNALSFVRRHVRDALRSVESSRAQKARILLTALAPSVSTKINAALNRRKS